MTSFTSSVLQQIPVGAISLTPNDFEKILEKTSRAVVEQLAKKFGFDLNEAYASLGTGVPTKGPKIKSMKVPDDWPYHGICARRTTGLDNKTNPEVVTYRWSALEFQPQLANLRIQIDTEKSTTTHWKLAAGSKAAFSANVHPSAAIVIDYNEDTEGWIPKLYEGSPTLESLDSHKDRCGISTLVSYINNPIVPQAGQQVQPQAQTAPQGFGGFAPSAPTLQPPPTPPPPTGFVGFAPPAPTQQPQPFAGIAQQTAQNQSGFSFGNPKHNVTPNPFATTSVWNKM